ncbi:hypothetical protein Tco_0377955 [Tanacetum coccineum]
MQGERLQLELGEFKTEEAMQILVSNNAFDANVDEPSVQDLALNADNVFQADQCDAFNSDVDEAFTAQTMFMANLSSTDLIYDEDGLSYDSDILSEVQNHDDYIDNVAEYHEVNEMQNDVQPNYVVDSDAKYTSDSNIIPYEQYFKDNVEQVVKNNVSSVTNDALMMIISDMHQLAVQCVSANEQSKLVSASLTAELARYKKQVELYERRSRNNTETNFKNDGRITPTGLIEGERGFEQTKECYPTEAIPFFKTLKEHFEGIQKALTKEVKEIKEIFKQMEAEVDQNVVDKKSAEIKRKNRLIKNENLIADCLSNELLYSVMNSKYNVSNFFEMHDAYTVEQARNNEIEDEISKLKYKIQKDDHSEMIKRFSNLEVEHLNLQLKYQHLKESFGNNKSKKSSDVPTFDSVFKYSDADPILDTKALDSQNKDLTEKVTALQDLNERFREKNEKVKQHYKELYDSINITRAKTLKKTHLKGKRKCVTMGTVKPKFFAPGMYAIDVEPIPSRNRNNRKVHLDYLKHLNESVETLCEKVEDARIEKHKIMQFTLPAFTL